MMSTIQKTFTYPGGKTRSLRQIVQHIPKEFTEYREPFVGGGTIAVNLMRRNPKAKYWINDVFKPTFSTWRNLRDCPMEMVRWILGMKKAYDGNERGLNRFCRDTLLESDDFEMGCKNFVLLQTNWGGLLGRRSAYTPKNRFHDASVIGLLDVASILERVDVEITNLDYSECLGGTGDDVVIYADPPYDLKRADLYGINGEIHRRFSHADLSQQMKGCRHKWLLSYNDTENIRQMYADFYMVPIDVVYGMKNSTGQELLIGNFEV